MDEEQIKVEKWDQNAVRIALDDAAKKVILNLGYKQNHTLMDIRLFICTFAVFAAGVALVWDWLYPFPASRTVIIGCVGTYGFLMLVLTAYMSYVEKSIFLVAHQKDSIGIDPDIVWTLSSSMIKYDSFYTLTMECKEEEKAVRFNSIKKCVGEIFDEDGVLHMDVFEPMVLNLHKSLKSDKKST